FLPPPACLVGGIAITLSKKGQRLGDLLAGTIVVRSDTLLEPTQRASKWGAAWIVNVESGRSRRGMMFGDMRIDANQLNIIERFLARRDSLALVQRQELAWKIATPFLKTLGENPEQLAQRPERFAICEQALEKILAAADTATNKSEEVASEDAADAKRKEWRGIRRR